MEHTLSYREDSKQIYQGNLLPSATNTAEATDNLQPTHLCFQLLIRRTAAKNAGNLGLAAKLLLWESFKNSGKNTQTREMARLGPNIPGCLSGAGLIQALSNGARGWPPADSAGLP